LKEGRVHSGEGTGGGVSPPWKEVTVPLRETVSGGVVDRPWKAGKVLSGEETFGDGVDRSCTMSETSVTKDEFLGEA
jgi:hypothetical protein